MSTPILTTPQGTKVLVSTASKPVASTEVKQEMKKAMLGEMWKSQLPFIAKSGAVLLVLAVVAYFALTRGHKAIGGIAIGIGAIVAMYVAFIEWFAWTVYFAASKFVKKI